MYELVKRKSKWKTIILGIVGLFILTSVLKMVLHQPAMTLDEQLVKVANEINKRAPMTVDSTARLDNAVALPGNRFRYNYTLLTLAKADIDTVALAQQNKKYF